jgi:hypothetical protein
MARNQAKSVCCVEGRAGLVWTRTQVLNILISCKRQDTALCLVASSCPGTESLVDNDAVGGRCGDESQTIVELRPFGVVVEGDVGDAVPKNGE